MLVGAPSDDDGVLVNNGAAYLYLGGCDGGGTCGHSKSGLYVIPAWATKAGKPTNVRIASGADLAFWGDSSGDMAGKALSGGDVNDDGYSDVVIGAPMDSTAGSSAGAAYLALGGCASISLCGAIDGFFAYASSGMDLSVADVTFEGEATSS